MLAVDATRRKLQKALLGRATPRVAPPLPARTGHKEFATLAAKLGWPLFPWQETAARYLTATAANGRLLYPEIAIIVGRQNGKTTLLLPLVIGRLLQGRRIMHTAQNRSLPRDFFEDFLAPLIEEHYKGELRSRRGISFGAGMEKITFRNGGVYRIVAPTKGGARGPANDLVIVDELREMESDDFIGGAEPTLSASPNPQMVYLSNAGTEASVVLNGLRDRADTDPALAYLEWSADPDRAPDDIKGWLEANPSIGHMPGKLDYLERKFKSYSLQRQMALFETEHLCRWVSTTRVVLVDPATWQRARKDLEKPLRPMMAVSMDPSGKRASAAIAWQQTDGSVGLRIVNDVRGEPIDVEKVGPELKKQAARLGVSETAFDPWTDADLARQLAKTRPVNGREYANASENFARVVESGRLAWDDADQVSDDLPWTARRPHESGAWMVVKAQEDRPITAALAAVRAVWLASGPRPAPPEIF